MDRTGFLALLIALTIPVVFLLLIVVGVRREREKARKGEGTAPLFTCESEVTPNRKMRGTGWVEFFLWFCAVLPGLIYHLWRASDRAPKCSACGAKNLVPTNSPAAKRTKGHVSELVAAR